ncbi:hypothetical protein WV31_10035 [Magnetospirillum sp. ME-1]|uniref:hypothetical protein n=1 Tax=Magnetospirillum sp. ME-1 TaxID=1639348 RepID=UPI000A17B42F|nr:hypothetical protein [Magnetospirillum sp. ME-1]ARJ65967.1 hypothetical protein WV31_10035 [Magnetospirillum sp. ME-1]
MPRYRVLMTRDVTESASVVVSARSKAAAYEKAKAQHETAEWAVDDGNYRGPGDIYLGGGLEESVELLEEGEEP